MSQRCETEHFYSMLQGREKGSWHFGKMESLMTLIRHFVGMDEFESSIVVG